MELSLVPFPTSHLFFERARKGKGGFQPTSRCLAVRSPGSAPGMESRDLSSDPQRWEAAPVNNVHPVAARSVSPQLAAALAAAVMSTAWDEPQLTKYCMAATNQQLGKNERGEERKNETRLTNKRKVRFQMVAERAELPSTTFRLEDYSSKAPSAIFFYCTIMH